MCTEEVSKINIVTVRSSISNRIIPGERAVVGLSSGQVRQLTIVSLKHKSDPADWKVISDCFEIPPSDMEKHMLETFSPLIPWNTIAREALDAME